MASLPKHVLELLRPFEAKIAKCLLENKTLEHTLCMIVKHTFPSNTLFMSLMTLNSIEQK
jgi:hypothetical protein